MFINVRSEKLYFDWKLQIFSFYLYKINLHNKSIWSVDIDTIFSWSGFSFFKCDREQRLKAAPIQTFTAYALLSWFWEKMPSLNNVRCYLSAGRRKQIICTPTWMKKSFAPSSGFGLHTQDDHSQWFVLAYTTNDVECSYFLMDFQ